MSKKYTHKQGFKPEEEIQIAIIKKNIPNLHGDFIPKIQLVMNEWLKYLKLKQHLVDKYANVPPFNGEPQPVIPEEKWHNVTDQKWEIIANAFKSYTSEGAVEWLKYQGYKITKE